MDLNIITVVLGGAALITAASVLAGVGIGAWSRARMAKQDAQSSPAAITEPELPKRTWTQITVEIDELSFTWHTDHPTNEHDLACVDHLMTKAYGSVAAALIVDALIEAIAAHEAQRLDAGLVDLLSGGAS